MSSTSVHLPEDIVLQLDRLATERGTSRNRLILQACRELIGRDRGDWPEGFFSANHLSEEDLATLRSATEEMEAAIYAARHDRPVSPL